MVTELASPAGLPKVNASCPSCSRSESPKRSGRNPVVSTFSRARSVSLSSPMRRASRTDPPAAGASATFTRSAPLTTCAFVRISPPESTTTPDPITCSRATINARPGAATGPSAVTSTCTMEGDTRPTSDSTALSSWASGAIEPWVLGALCAASVPAHRNSAPHAAATLEGRVVGFGSVVVWMLMIATFLKVAALPSHVSVAVLSSQDFATPARLAVQCKRVISQKMFPRWTRGIGGSARGSRHSRRADATRPVAQRRKRPYGHIGERRADGQYDLEALRQLSDLKEGTNKLCGHESCTGGSPYELRRRMWFSKRAGMLVFLRMRRLPQRKAPSRAITVVSTVALSLPGAGSGWTPPTVTRCRSCPCAVGLTVNSMVKLSPRCSFSTAHETYAS